MDDLFGNLASNSRLILTFFSGNISATFVKSSLHEIRPLLTYTPAAALYMVELYSRKGDIIMHQERKTGSKCFINYIGKYFSHSIRHGVF